MSKLWAIQFLYNLEMVGLGNEKKCYDLRWIHMSIKSRSIF